MRTNFGSEKGIALVTTLMFMVLGFALVATLLLLVTNATKLAGIEQNYATALDAAKGGADMVVCMIQNNIAAPPAVANLTTQSPASQCTSVKLNNSTAAWYGNGVWTTANGCPTQVSGGATSTDPTVNPDLTFSLSGYLVSAKIIDTNRTASTTDTTSPCYPDGCSYFSVVVRAQATNGGENANITFLYRYPIP